MGDVATGSVGAGLPVPALFSAKKWQKAAEGEAMAWSLCRVHEDWEGFFSSRFPSFLFLFHSSLLAPYYTSWERKRRKDEGAKVCIRWRVQCFKVSCTTWKQMLCQVPQIHQLNTECSALPAMRWCCTWKKRPKTFLHCSVIWVIKSSILDTLKWITASAGRSPGLPNLPHHLVEE